MKNQFKYLFIASLLLLNGCASSRKIPVTSSEKVVPQKNFNKKEIAEIEQAFSSCNTASFKKFGVNEFKALSLNGRFSSSWERLQNKLIKQDENIESCLNFLNFLGAHNVYSPDVMLVFKLLNSNDLKIIDQMINSKTIPVQTLAATEEYFKKIFTRLQHRDQLEISEKFKINNTTIVHFFEKMDEFYSTSKQSRPIVMPIKNEEWIIGKKYYVCGFQVNAKGYHSKDKRGVGFESTKVENCANNMNSLATITDLDQKWIFVQPLRVEYDGPVSELAVEEPFYVLRDELTTPYVLSDTNFEIAIPENDAGIYGLDGEYLKVNGGNSDCEGKIDNMPELRNINEKGRRHYSDGRYLLPKGFKKENAFFRKYIIGSPMPTEGCGC